MNAVALNRRTLAPSRLLTRYLRPMAIMLTVVTYGIAYQYLIYSKWPEGPFADFAGYCALVAASVLLVGWLGRVERAYQLGLAGVAAIAAGRMVMYISEQGWDCPGVWYSLAYSLGAFSAWVVERFDSKWRFEWDG